MEEKDLPEIPDEEERDEGDEGDEEAEVAIRPYAYQFGIYFQTMQRLRIGMQLNILAKFRDELIERKPESRWNKEVLAALKAQKKLPAKKQKTLMKIKNVVMQDALKEAIRGGNVIGELAEPTRNALDIFSDSIALEKKIVGFLEKSASEWCSAWPWIIGQRGLGPRLSGMLVGTIDITRCPTASSLWRYCGLAVVDGKAERAHRWQTLQAANPSWTEEECKLAAKLHYNKRTKKTCYLISRAFIMAKHKTYEPIYREAKEFYTRVHPEWILRPSKRKLKGKIVMVKIKGGDLHVDLAARRKMVKVFLVHLWLKWREAEGLPTRGPYVQEYMSHEVIAPPEPEGGKA